MSRTARLEKLYNVALAMHNYHDTHNSLPPAWVDVQGLWSPPVVAAHANVAILPNLDQGNLANLYDYDVPWDHANNQDLATRMPAVYQCPSTPGGGTPALRQPRGGPSAAPVDLRRRGLRLNVASGALRFRSEGSVSGSRLGAQTGAAGTDSHRQRKAPP